LTHEILKGLKAEKKGSVSEDYETEHTQTKWKKLQQSATLKEWN